MDWISRLGLQAQAARWRRACAEGGQAAQDRLELAALEWAQYKRQLLQQLLLAGLCLLLLLGALLLLSLALLVQYWETPQRQLVAWLLAGGWVVGTAGALLWLRQSLAQSRTPFALTRHELQQDWQMLKNTDQTQGGQT